MSDTPSPVPSYKISMASTPQMHEAEAEMEMEMEMEMEGTETQVKVTRISNVAPATPTARHRMFLPNFDLMWLPVDKVQMLLFYRVSPTEERSAMVDSLKKSLAVVLVDFYPFAGRLDKGESGRPEIDCNGAGIEFIEAYTSLSFHDLEKDHFHHKPFFQNLVPLPHPFQQGQNCNSPLFSVQVTFFEAGGICIGTTFHHVVADGNSFWHFMISWAECSRGLPISKPPQHNRTILKREMKSSMSISFKPQDVVNERLTGVQIYKLTTEDIVQPQPVAEREGKKISSISSACSKTQVIYSTFRFSKEMIRDLKARSGALSSFVAVAAQFWRCVMRARQVPEEEHVMFCLLADCRGRAKPQLPSTYFGNCLSSGAARTTARKLLSEDLRFAADVLHELVNYSKTELDLDYLIEWLETPEKGRSYFNEVLGSFSTIVVSSPKFPVYEIDHGWGKPLNVQVPPMTEIGGMALFGGNDGESIVVSTCLPPNQMHDLSLLLSISM